MEDATSAKGASQMNLVIVGSKYSLKYLIGNIILGTNAFDALGDATFDNERREGEACERRVTLVKAPGWLRGYHLNDTPQLVKMEMTVSPTLCPPGPHAFILVINAEQPFRDVNRRSTQEHLRHCFGEKVWEHTTVVFSSRAQRSRTSGQDYIAKEGAPLQSLLEACGHRYHFLCDDDADISGKVKELFESISTTVDKNGRYTVNGTEIQGIKERRKEVDAKAEELHERSECERKKLTELLLEPKPKLRIMMVGWVFSGKSSTGNRILRDDVFSSGERTMNVRRESGVAAGREILMVDTPGWWKHFPAIFTPAAVKSEIVKAVSVCTPSPNVILVTVPLDTSFTDEQKRVMEDNMRLLGGRVWRHAMVLFTFGDSLGAKTIEQHVESEGKPLRWLVDKCEKRYHVINNRSTADDQVTELMEKMEEMVAGNSSFHFAETVNEPQPEEGTSRELAEEKDVSRGAKEITAQLNIEWNRKNWEKYHIYGANWSMFSPPSFSGSGKRTESSKEDEVEMEQRHGDEQFAAGLDDESEEDTASGSQKIMKGLLEREWSRREACVEFCYELFTEKRCMSEPDADQLHKSREKVLLWLRTQHTPPEKTEKENKRGKRKQKSFPTVGKSRRKRSFKAH